MKKQILTLLTIATFGFASNDIQAANKHKKSTYWKYLSPEACYGLCTALVIMDFQELAKMKTSEAVKELRDDCKHANEKPKEYKQELKNLLQKYASELTAQEIKQLKKIIRKL